MRRFKPARRLLLKFLLGSTILLILLIAALTTWLGIAHSRSVTLPTPTGRYQVGRTAFDWTDYGRKDPFSRQLKYRELPVWVWYPSLSRQKARAAPYLPRPWARLYENGWGIGSWLWQNPYSVHTHTIANAYPARGKYPVLVFEPGLGKKPSDYTTLLEEIASHGYIVVGIFPTDSTDVVLTDDRVIPSVYAAGDGMVPDRLIKIWARDTRFVMDRVVKLAKQPGSLLADHMDVSRIGVFGHSFGGATAAEVCREDLRCGAGADLDGTPFGKVVRTGLKKPFIFIRGDECIEGSSDSECQTDLMRTSAIMKSETGEHHELEIRGAKHFNFTDMSLTFAPLARPLGLLGPIDGARGLRITSAYLEAFFGYYLKEADKSLLVGTSSPYPEIRHVVPQTDPTSG